MVVLQLDKWRKNFVSQEAYDQFVHTLSTNTVLGQAAVVLDNDKVVCGFLHPEDLKNIVAAREAARLRGLEEARRLKEAGQ